MKLFTDDKMNSQFDISIEEWHKLAREGAQIPVSFVIDGDSMRPLLRKGKDKVTAVPVYRNLKKGDIVVFARNDGTYVCHRVWKIKNETVVTIGDACYGFDTPMHISQVWGIVIRKERNGKTVKIDSSLSRAFGRLWMSLRWLRITRRDIKRFFRKA